MILLSLYPIEPYLQIRFINSSPRVSGGTVVADFTINRRTVSVECFINGQGSKKECKLVLKTPPGQKQPLHSAYIQESGSAVV